MKDNRLWVVVLKRNPGFKETNSPELCRSFKRYSGSAGYCARAGGRSVTKEGECATPRPTRGDVRGEGGTRPEAHVRRGWASGGGALPPLTLSLSVLGLLVLQSSCASVSLPFDAFKSL